MIFEFLVFASKTSMGVVSQREGATYDEVKYLVAKHKELASLLQSELIKCKTINGKVLTDAEKVTLTEKFLERAIKWATPSASARALRDQVLNFRHMSEGEMWRTYFDEFRGKLEMARMACQMEGIEPDSIEKDHSLCVMLRSKLTSELRVQHAIKENMWDEMGEMGQAIKDEAYGDLYDFFRYVDKMEAAKGDDSGEYHFVPLEVAPPSRRLSVDASQDTARPPTLSQRSTGSRGSSACFVQRFLARPTRTSSASGRRAHPRVYTIPRAAPRRRRLPSPPRLVWHLRRFARRLREATRGMEERARGAREERGRDARGGDDGRAAVPG